MVGDNIIKVIRFIFMYGVGRTWFKVSGRLRSPFLRALSLKRKKGSVGMIGCGQFAYSTIGYFLRKVPDGGIVACHDPDEQASKSFARFHHVPMIAKSGGEVIQQNAVKIVYIASNHASHADYACKALQEGKTVYIEKPVSVSMEQLARLHAIVKQHGHAPIFAGYNRPFSGAIRDLRKHCLEFHSPLTLSCFISGHVLGENHWYRDPKEGTRICGNVGHWLDLAVHMLQWGELPDEWDIRLAWSNPLARDEDMAICMTSQRGDLINIVLTARTEPFEGINETINLQWGDTIAKIDDFRHMTVWRGKRKITKRYWPKDVGHRRAILQPFHGEHRNWKEIELSTLLMLKIADMVKREREYDTFSFSQYMLMLN